MIGFQPDRNVDQPHSRRTVLIAWLCLLLLALLAFAQVTHFHELQSDADHCPLCVVIHAAAPVAAAPAPAILVVPLGAPALAPESRPVLRTWHPSLFTRPPPASC